MVFRKTADRTLSVCANIETPQRSTWLKDDVDLFSSPPTSNLGRTIHQHRSSASATVGTVGLFCGDAQRATGGSGEPESVQSNGTYWMIVAELKEVLGRLSRRMPEATSMPHVSHTLCQAAALRGGVVKQPSKPYETM